MESAILQNMLLSISVVYKCRRIPSYDLKSTLTHSQARLTGSILASLCGSIGKDLVYHACGHEFESRTFSDFLQRL